MRISQVRANYNYIKKYGKDKVINKERTDMCKDKEKEDIYSDESFEERKRERRERERKALEQYELEELEYKKEMNKLKKQQRELTIAYIIGAQKTFTTGFIFRSRLNCPNAILTQKALDNVSKEEDSDE